MSEWISVEERGHPDFTVHGFHITDADGKLQKIQFRTEDGDEHEDFYQGWVMYGMQDRHDVTHWRPITGEAVVLGEPK